MDIKYQQKENLEALVNEQINVLELTDILKIDKNLTISLTKWPLDYAAGGLYQADSFGQTVCLLYILYIDICNYEMPF